MTNLPHEGTTDRSIFPKQPQGYLLYTKHASSTNTSSTNKYHLPPSFPQHSTATCSCTHTQLPPVHAHTFCTRLYEHAYLLSTSRLSCQSCRPSLLHPAASTRKLECRPLLLAPLPHSGTRLRRSSICSTTTSTSFLQLAHNCRPFKLHPAASILLEVRMSTPWLCWHYSLARVRLRHSSIRSKTIHVSCSDHSFKTCS